MNANYSDVEKAFDRERVNVALGRINHDRAHYNDVIVVSDVITIHDVCDINLDTSKGPQRIGDVCSREEIVHILRAFQGNPCGDPVLVAQYALEDYRQTQALTQE